MRRAFGRPLTTWAGLQAQVVRLVGPLRERRWQENRQHIGRPFDLKRESDRSARDRTPTFREIVSEIRAFAWRPDGEWLPQPYLIGTKSVGGFVKSDIYGLARELPHRAS